MWKGLAIFWPFGFFLSWIFIAEPTGGKIWIAFGWSAILTAGMAVLMGVKEGNIPESNSG